jgi:hypothetical protein
MKKRVARVVVVVLTFVLLAVGHSGCGGKSYSPTAPSTPSTTPAPTPRY